jgi:hypothetical protein
LASLMAVSRPIPLLAPVTKAVPRVGSTSIPFFFEFLKILLKKSFFAG